MQPARNIYRMERMFSFLRWTETDPLPAWSHGRNENWNGNMLYCGNLLSGALADILGGTETDLKIQSRG